MHSNFSHIETIYDWVFGNRSTAMDMTDALAEHSLAIGQCSDGCVLHCVQSCGAYFVEHITPEDERWGEPRGRWNGTIYYPRYNETFRRSGFPLSLTDWNQTDEDGVHFITPGHWRGDPGCFETCVDTCAVGNCSLACVDGCSEAVEGGNETAQAYGLSLIHI